MKSNRYVVHDEFGPIRAFHLLEEAEKYLQHLLDCQIDAHLVVKPKPAKPDLSNLGEALF